MGNICKMNSYIGIGYILPTNGKKYMLVEFIHWYWIYSVNNWGIYAIWRVSVLPLGAGLRNMQFLEYVHMYIIHMYSRIYVHILEIAYSPTLLLKGALTPSKWHISPNC